MSTRQTPRQSISRNALLLMVRQSIIQLGSLVSSIVLARILDPQDYGIYAIIGFFTQFLTLISDGGIGASLIQLQHDLNKNILSAAFTFMQFFYAGASIIAIPLVSVFVYLYRGISLNPWMIYVLIVQFYLTSFRLVPAALLERDLSYGKLSLVEVIEYLTLQVVSVILAFSGDGVWSFIFGALASRVIGIILLNYLAPFAPRFYPSYITARPLLKFGLSLQFADVLNFIQASLTPTVVAFRLGPSAVGFANFARKLTSYPTYPLNVVNRMMFPVLARVQDDDGEFVSTLNRFVKLYIFILFGMMSILLPLLPETVKFVFGEKWMPSIELVYASMLGLALSGYTSPIAAAIQAKGLSRIFVMTNSVRFVATWAIGIPAVAMLGFNGLMLLNLAGLVTFPVFIVATRKYFVLRLWAPLWCPLLSICVVTVIVKAVIQVRDVSGVLVLLVLYLASGCLYLGICLLIDRTLRKEIIERARSRVYGKRRRDVKTHAHEHA